MDSTQFERGVHTGRDWMAELLKDHAPEEAQAYLLSKRAEFGTPSAFQDGFLYGAAEGLRERSQSAQ